MRYEAKLTLAFEAPTDLAAARAYHDIEGDLCALVDVWSQDGEHQATLVGELDRAQDRPDDGKREAEHHV